MPKTGLDLDAVERLYAEALNREANLERLALRLEGLIFEFVPLAQYTQAVEAVRQAKGK